MSSTQLPLQSRGIYRNLPTFLPLAHPLTALVTGANGISGFHTMRVLLESPERWEKVYALSRRPPQPEMMALLSADARSRVEHIACDFMADPKDIAMKINDKGVREVDVVFFYSYIQPKVDTGATAWSNADALLQANSALLRNFLSALDYACLAPARVVLQTGAKHYGIHLGPPKSPIAESDPRVTIEPNFYYPQEDMLFDYCKTHPGSSWNVIRPSWIIGAVSNAQMNAMHPLAVYAAVQAYLGRKLEFPGDSSAWMGEHVHSTAMLTGYLTEWAVLEDKCKNEAFNANDTAIFAWGGFWPELARWYGVNEIGWPELDETKLKAFEMPYQPPIGFGPPGRLRYSFTLRDWAADLVNQRAWKDIMKIHNLTHNPFNDIEGNFTFGDVAIWVVEKRSLSMNKARLFGWNGFVDTTQSVFETFSEMSRLGMLPPLVVDKAQSSI